MPRYAARIAYDGTHFSGFQRQQQERTVQAVLEATLTRLNGGVLTKVHGSGRTDAGVHAYGQVIHFDLLHTFDPEKLRFALDTQTGEDITVRDVVRVQDDFHARYDATDKVYHYYFKHNRVMLPWQRPYMTQIPYPLEISLMQEALQLCVGTHDFTGFCAQGSSVEDKVRTIYQLELTELSALEQIYCVSFYGNGFLYKMVRNIMGTAFKIGAGRFPVQRMSEVLLTGNRQLAGPTAPSQGLYLMHVGYPLSQKGEQLWDNLSNTDINNYLWGVLR